LTFETGLTAARLAAVGLVAVCLTGACTAEAAGAVPLVAPAVAEGCAASAVPATKAVATSAAEMVLNMGILLVCFTASISGRADCRDESYAVGAECVLKSGSGRRSPT
jgi:hypothetical protein